METLEFRYKRVLKALKRLDFVVKKFKKELDKQIDSATREEEFLLIQDALFKRFEICYDIMWKFLKVYLQEEYGLDVASPRKVFQECLQQKIVSPEQAVVLDKIVEARNYASHTYDEDLACEIALQISTYAQLMNQVAQSLDVKNT